MKAKLLLFVFLTPLFIFSQTQIGDDIEGKVLGDGIGKSVSLSDDGNIVVIGAPEMDINGSNAGCVRIYQNDAGSWTQVGADIYGKVAQDNFGNSVSISSDGTIVAIGAWLNSNNGDYSGCVRVFKNISDTWTQIGADIDGEVAGDRFGNSVSISSNGSIVAVGAIANDGNGANSGHVQVYEYDSSTWTQLGTDIDGEAASDYSGASVSISSDGTIVAIGAHSNDGNGADSGHVRVYEYNSSAWTQVGTDIDGEAAGDQSGWSVSLSSDGSIVAVGAIANDGNGANSGHVRIFKNILGTWTQIGTDIDGETANLTFGGSVSLSSEGTIVAIGATRNSENGTSSGEVRVYQNILGIWTQIGSDLNGTHEYQNFGTTTSLNGAGSILAIGTSYSYGGIVQVYDLSTVLSLEDNLIAQKFNIYPNPASEILNLSFNASLELKKVKIYNILGQPILESEEKSLNISSLSTGVYYVEITTNEGKGVKKLMVK